MTAVRALQITYGSLTASSTVGSCTLTLVELHRFRKGREDFEVSFEVLLTTPTGDHADFASAVATVEAAYRKPYQDLTVSALDPTGATSAAELLALSHDDASAIEIEAELSKPGVEEHDSYLSRRYSVRISGGLPPDSTLNGIREETYDLAKDGACRQTLTIRGRYTALDGTGARANALTRIAAKGVALTALLGGSWSVSSGPNVSGVSTNDLEAEAEVVWVEEVHTGSGSLSGDSRIRNPKLEIGRSLEGARGSADERALATMTATYTAEICHTETTELLALYLATIRPALIYNMQLSAPGRYFALISDDFRPELKGNTLTVNLTALTDTGGDLLEVTRTERLEVDHGAIVGDVWDESANVDDEEPTAAYVWPGPKKVQFVEEVRQVVIGAATSSLRPGGFAGGGLGAQRAPAGAGPFGLAMGDPFQNFLGIGVISKPGESFLDFLGPESGAAAAAEAAAGGAAGVAGQRRGFKVTTLKSTTPGVRGIRPHQFEVREETTTRTTRYVLGVGSSGSGGGRAPSSASPGSTRTR